MTRVAPKTVIVAGGSIGHFGRFLDCSLVDIARPVVLDSLSEIRLLAQSTLRYRKQILALKQFFAGRHCTVGAVFPIAQISN